MTAAGREAGRQTAPDAAAAGLVAALILTRPPRRLVRRGLD